MTILFSEVSKLLLGNWEAYQDVLKADRKLRKELQQALMSIESRIRKSNIWNPQWHIQPNGAAQLYIWHDNWEVEKEPLIWIGVEDVSLEGVIADGEPASAYVWVSKSQATSLIDGLRRMFEKKEIDGYGETVTGKNGYVLQQVLPKCLPEDIDRFESVFLDPLFAFLTHYVKYEPDITRLVQEYSKTVK